MGFILTTGQKGVGWHDGTMRKHLLLALGVAMDGLIAAALGVEAFAVATAVLGVACAYAYRQELRAACRLVLGQSSLSPGGNRNAAGAPSDDAEITSDGKEVAKMMLRARDLDEVERLRTTYKRASHPKADCLSTSSTRRTAIV